MSEPTAPDLTPALRLAVLGAPAVQIHLARVPARAAFDGLQRASAKLAAAGMPAGELKRLDDVAQLVRHADETYVEAGKILRRLAAGVPEPTPAGHEQAEPGTYYEFAGYAPELGGEG